MLRKINHSFNSDLGGISAAVWFCIFSGSQLELLFLGKGFKWFSGSHIDKAMKGGVKDTIFTAEVHVQ